MTVQEGKDMIEELKASGWNEEEIVAGFYQLFTEDEININELGDLVGLVGYELSEEFKAMSPEDQKTKGWAEEAVDEDVKEGEQTENDGDDNSPSEDEEKPQEEPKNDAGAESGAESEKDDEEAQRAKAKKLFGLD